MCAGPDSDYAEAFRMLRTNLYLYEERNVGQVVVLTSPCQEDGKTTCALALAGILAADARDVLLIDGDLRKPSHHQLLGRPLEPGLRTVLAGECDWQSTVAPVTARMGEFFAVTSGELAAPELLSNSALRTFLEHARRRFDYIIVDTAAFPLVSDALVLAMQADMVLSVLRLQNTTRKLAAEHLLRLSRVAPHFGVILNGVAPRATYGVGATAYRPLQRDSEARADEHGMTS
jgi:capsular exopolysaccharide synthesis family protein